MSLSTREVELRLNQLLHHLDGDANIEAFNLIAQARELLVPPANKKGTGTYPHIDSDANCPCVECWADEVRLEMQQ